MKSDNLRSHQMTKFQTSVWNWKWLAIFIWSYAAYILLNLFNLILAKILKLHIRWYLYPLSTLSLFGPLYIYVQCLTVVPVRHNVLVFNKWLNRFGFTMAEFAWVFINTFIFAPFKTSFIVSLVTTTLILLHFDFTVYVTFKRFRRIETFKDAFLVHLNYKYNYLIILASCLLSFNPLLALFSVPLFCLLSAMLTLASIIAGERTSFALPDSSSRLNEGLSSYNEIYKYWAYSDLLEATSKTQKLRREYLFGDGGKGFADIAGNIVRCLENYAESHENLAEDASLNAPLHRLNDPTIQRDKSYTITKKSVPLKTALKTWWKTRGSRMIHMKSEAKATNDSIIVMKGIRASVSLIYLASSEDKFGIIQVQAENLLNAIISVLIAVQKTVHIKWYTPPYSVKWICDDPCELTDQVLDVAYWAVDNLLREFGEKFDLSLLSKDNAELAETFINTKN